jgi:hypothetical protein
MCRALCAVVLLPSLTAAQSDAAAMVQSVQPQPSLSVAANPTRPVYRSYTYYNEIRQGTTEDLAVQLAVPGFVTLPASRVPGIVPLRLELQPSEGLTVSKIRYPKLRQRKLAFQREPAQVTDAWQSPIQFKLHADPNTPPGPRTVAGKLTFQAISDATGVGAVEEVGVQIPITVVPHDAKVTRANWPIHKMPVAVVVLLIVFLPVLVPVVLPIYLICLAEGPRRCPD